GAGGSSFRTRTATRCRIGRAGTKRRRGPTRPRSASTCTGSLSRASEVTTSCPEGAFRGIQRDAAGQGEARRPHHAALRDPRGRRIDLLGRALTDPASLDVCSLTTRGRVSGDPHTIEIWFGIQGETVYLLSGGRERSDWVRNLIAEPAVELRLGEATYQATARVV